MEVAPHPVHVGRAPVTAAGRTDGPGRTRLTLKLGGFAALDETANRLGRDLGCASTGASGLADATDELQTSLRQTNALRLLSGLDARAAVASAGRERETPSYSGALAVGSARAGTMWDLSEIGSRQPASVDEPRRRQRPGRRAAARLILLVLIVVPALTLGVHRDGTYRPFTTPSESSESGARTASAPQANMVGSVGERSFGWAAVPHAVGYDVRFSRDGRQIFAARPSSPRLVLPVAWRYSGKRIVLRPGRYTWTVRPLFHGRRGPAVIQAAFVLKAG